MSEEPKSPFADREPNRMRFYQLYGTNLIGRDRLGVRQAIRPFDKPRDMLRRLDTKFAKIVEDFTGKRGLAEQFWDRLWSRPEWTPETMADLESVIRRFEALIATLGAEASRCRLLAAEMKRQLEKDNKLPHPGQIPLKDLPKPKLAADNPPKPPVMVRRTPPPPPRPGARPAKRIELPLRRPPRPGPGPVAPDPSGGTKTGTSSA